MMNLHPNTPPGDHPAFKVRRDTLKPTERREDVTRRPTYSALRESLRRDGINTVPLLVGKADADGIRPIIDGNSRAFAAEDEGIDILLVFEVEQELDETGLIETSIKVNGNRRKLTPEELGAQAERLIQLTGCTQEEAAHRLHSSAAAVSRGLTSLLMPEYLREKAAQLGSTVRALIAAISDPAIQGAAIEFALTTGKGGKLQSRDSVQLFVKRKLAEHKPGRKANPSHEVKFPKGSMIEAMTIRPGFDPAKLAEDFRAKAKLAEKNAHHGEAALIAILKGRGDDPPSAAIPA